MAFKRTRDGEAEDITVMANCLMLLSGSGTTAYGGGASSRVFKCKTCDREFPSFQALGGHRASHKKPRLMGGAAGDHLLQPASPPKPKTHECSICGLEFPIGQALGGHMRRHRAAMVDDQVPPPPSFLSLSPPHVQVVKKANSSSRRVLSLDLNLTPSENKFVFGKIDVPLFLIASSESH